MEQELSKAAAVESFVIDPETTPRAQSYKDFVTAPMPMVTLFKELDVTRLVRKSKQGYKYNMLMAYCIGQAAKRMPEMLLQMCDKTMLKYEKFAIDIIVSNKKGMLNYVDIPIVDDLDTFNQSYLQRTKQAAENCENLYVTDASIICTSALVKYEFDGLVNLYHCLYDHPYLVWGKYIKKWFRYKQKMSFQWHHIILDGGHACRFMEELQKSFNELR